MKILLPADGSACSLRAVDQLIAHIDCLREVPEIHLLHVHLPIPIGRVQAHVGKETLHAYYLEEGQQQLQAAQQKLDGAGRFHTTHIHVGQPAEVIGKMAAEKLIGVERREPRDTTKTEPTLVVRESSGPVPS